MYIYIFFLRKGRYNFEVIQWYFMKVKGSCLLGTDHYISAGANPLLE